MEYPDVFRMGNDGMGEGGRGVGVGVGIHPFEEVLLDEIWEVLVTDLPPKIIEVLGVLWS